MTEETIYVALLGEGLDVWRPVKARRLSGDRYLILEQEYDRDSETWASEPGTVVECRRELRDGRELVIALRAVERNSSKSDSQGRAEATSDAVPSKGAHWRLGAKEAGRSPLTEWKVGSRRRPPKRPDGASPPRGLVRRLVGRN